MSSAAQQQLEAAAALARRAGAELRSWQGRLGKDDVSIKGVHRDLVTRADLASEEILLSGLRALFPEDGYYAEESGCIATDREFVWYLDPLDGTTNFVHGLPLYAVSMARVRHGRPELAVVYLPVLDECFAAARGGGAQCNGRRLQVSATTQLSDALLATGFPYRRQTLIDNNLENFSRLFLKARGIRRMGSAAIDLAYTAAGRFDAFWELHLGPYDVAAGGLLVQEAGGVCDTLVPGGDWLHGRNLVCGPAALVETLRAVLLAGRPDRYPELGERPGAPPA